MNDDELRDHLRSTLEPVSSPTPELARLRRVARRRRQRRQFTAGGLGLLLIAGAGIGIAEATTGHSGRATVSVGPASRGPSGPTAPGNVNAPCKGGRVTVPVGDQLRLENCPVGLSSHVDDPTVLAAGDKPDTFAAKNDGTTNVELYVKPQCSPGTMCPQYIRGLGTLVVTVTSAG
jgi:hypothetical protein